MCAPSSTNRTQMHRHHHNPDHRIKVDVRAAHYLPILTCQRPPPLSRQTIPQNPSSLTTPCNCWGKARHSLHVIFIVIVKDIQVPWSVVNLLNNLFRCSLPHAVLFCIAQSLLLLPSTHIGRGRRCWAVQGTHLEFFPHVPPKKTCIIVFFWCVH